MLIKNIFLSIILIFSLIYLTNAQFFHKLKGAILNRNGKRRNIKNTIFDRDKYLKVQSQESIDSIEISTAVYKIRNNVVKRILTNINQRIFKKY